MTKTVPALLMALAASLSAFHARAEADQQTIDWSEQEAVQDAREGNARGYHCETIQTEDGTWEAQCDDPADESVRACEIFSQTYQDQDMAYEACMTIAYHTPGAVR